MMPSPGRARGISLRPASGELSPKIATQMDAGKAEVMAFTTQSA